MLFHYTTLLHVPGIHDAGRIRRSTDDGLVWLSSRDHWEPAAGKIFRTAEGSYHVLTFAEQDEKMGVARFVVLDQLSTIGWKDIQKFAGYSAEWTAEVERRSLEIGADVCDWQACTSDIDLKHLRFEGWCWGRWQPVPIQLVADTFRSLARDYGFLPEQIELQPLIAHIREQFRLDWSGIHGAPHWSRVKHHGLRLGKLRGGDLKVIELFAFLHDSCRESDANDPHHGERAAELAASLNGRLFQLTNPQLSDLVEACRDHSDGKISLNATVQSCWDADRLDLGRVGRMPDPAYLSSQAAPLIAGAWEWARGGKAPA